MAVVKTVHHTPIFDMTWQCLLFALLLANCNAQTLNRAPHFIPGGDMARLSIPEDFKVGLPVYHLQGLDPEGSKVHYSISGEYFTVDRDSGIVTLVKPLDRETTELIEVIVSVTDEEVAGVEPNTVSLRREISVLDVNDNAPVFHGRPYMFSVSETTKAGTVLYSNITVTDADGGVNADINLTCMPVREGEDPCSVFNITSEKVNEGFYVGSIISKTALDYEQFPSYRLVLKATDMALDTTKRLTATANVVINIIDVQDQPPVFLDAPYSATVPEGLKNGMKIMNIKAKDGDIGNPNPVTLTIEDDHLGLFKLIKEEPPFYKKALIAVSELVTTNNTLDREHPYIVQNGGIYTFNVKATEMINSELPGASSTSRVTIVVTDVDDEIPLFNGHAFNISVSEDIGKDTPLPGLNLVAYDSDIGENGRFTLKLRNVHNSKGMFKVYPKSAIGRTPVVIKVSNSDAFDYDVEDPDKRQYEFDVVASVKGDGGEDIEVSSARVTVNLLDANDNSPVFAQSSYHIHVKEDVAPGTLIANLSATDADSGTYGEITYDIKGFGVDKFNTDKDKGGVYVSENSQGLDYETQKSFSLTFEAEDGGGRISTVNLLIDVEDINDNKPVFEQNEYSRTIREGAASFEPQFFVRATDADGPEQGGSKVFYSIQSSNAGNVLFVEPVSGEVKLNSPARSSDTSHGQYELVIRATDAGTPPLHSDVNVYIRVGVPGNQRPIFRGNKDVANKPPGYSVNIPENSPPGTKVLTVVAMDPDGQDSLLQYFIVSGAKDNFVMDKKSGVITVSPDAHLDRETGGSHYDIIVHAVDSGLPIHETATATVQVEITDINNKAPKFTSESGAYTHHISERAEIGDSVMFVKAEDPDLNALLNYSIVEPIQATDKTGNALKPSGSFDFKSLFKINSTTGEITVAQHLDHQTVAAVMLTVQVEDLNAKENKDIQSAKAEVTLYIESFQYNNPIFTIAGWSPTNREITVKVPEEQPIGTILLELTAEDPTNKESITKFRMIKEKSLQAENYVTVSEFLGECILTNRLDYEALNEKFLSFQVEAVSDDETRSSDATIILEIEDINDNAPEFSEKVYKAQVVESSVFPHTVLNVHATDKDSSNGSGYGSIRYLLSGEDSVLFVISPTTGEIKVAPNADLDREKKSVLKMSVIALDTPLGGINQRKATAEIIIDVLDVNDNAPQFGKNHYTAVVPENAPVGHYVLSITTVDPDEGAGGQVTYDFSDEGDANGLFAINHSNGNITTKKLLTGKGRAESYQLQVRAQDAGKPPLSSDVPLSIYIADVFTNDGVPFFIKPALDEIAYISENSSIGSPVLQVEASDPDDPAKTHGKIVYKILNDGADSLAFKIDSKSGLITTRQLLDREKKSSYKLLLVVEDEGNPPQQASRILQVNVTDIDDHKPHFKRNIDDEPLEFTVLEEVEVGTTVGSIEAVDEDIGANGMIDYLITYGNEDGLFNIERTDTNKGLITVAKRIDREVHDQFLLTVKCFKKSLRPASYRKTYENQDLSAIQLRILVEDIDDNKPMFVDENVTLGVRLDVPVDSLLYKFEAIDIDSSAEPITYSLGNTTFTSMAQSIIDTVTVPTNVTFFQLNEKTGELRTAESMLGHGDGYFELQITANNTPVAGRDAVITTKVFVARDRNLLKFVFEKPPADVQKDIKSFKEEVEKALSLPVSLNVYEYEFYSKDDGSLDFSKTSSCFQLIGIERYDLDDTMRLMKDENNAELKDIYEKYKVESVEHCASVYAKADTHWYETWVLVAGGAVGTFGIVVAFYACYRFKRGCRNRTSHSFPQKHGDIPLSNIGHITKGSRATVHPESPSIVAPIRPYPFDGPARHDDYPLFNIPLPPPRLM